MAACNGHSHGDAAAPQELEEVPAPSVADVDACRCASWHALGDLSSHTFAHRHLPLPPDFVAYLLEDGLSLAADSQAMPARIRPDIAEQMESAFTLSDEDETDAGGGEADAGRAVGDAEKMSFEQLRASMGGGGSESSSDGGGHSSDDDDNAGVTPVRHFPELEDAMREAIESLGGAVTPKLTWSAPKDAVWMATTNDTRCQHPAEVVLLLKASDAVAYDLQDAYAQCVDAPGDGGDAGTGLKLTRGATLTLRKWAGLSPSMEFRCFVRRGNLRGVCQRDVANYYPFLPDQVNVIEEAIAVFWQEKVHGVFPLGDYVMDVYVTSQRKVKIIDFNPYGGATLPLLFDWNELDDVPGGAGDGDGAGAGAGEGGDGGGGDGGEGGFTDDLEFRVVRSQGHIRPAPQLGVPFDMYDRSADGALANFVEQQRRRQEANAGTAGP